MVIEINRTTSISATNGLFSISRLLSHCKIKKVAFLLVNNSEIFLKKKIEL